MFGESQLRGLLLRAASRHVSKTKRQYRGEWRTLQRCSSIQAAISSAIGHRSLQVFEDTTTCALQNADSGGIEVPVVTLDSTVPHDGKTKLIKIDVEGHEDQVLQGSSKIIENSKPVIFFECNPAGRDRQSRAFFAITGTPYSVCSMENPANCKDLLPKTCRINITISWRCLVNPRSVVFPASFLPGRRL